MKVTLIKKGRRMFDYIYIDGEYFTKIDREVLAISGIKEGNDISEEELSQLVSNSEEKRAKDKAFNLLSYRDHSKKELEDKLKRDYGEQSAKAVAAKMEDLGLINDDAFARKYAKELLFSKRYSARKAEYELVLKGIDRETAACIIEQEAPDAREQIKLLVEKKYKNIGSDEKVKKRAISFLQRYGYSWEDIKSVLCLYEENF